MWISLRVFHQIVGFFRKSSHISRIVLRGNVTREFEHNYDDDEEGNETILRFIKQSKNSERAAQFLADSFARHHRRRPIYGIRIAKSRKFCLESEILGFGIRNAANDGNLESKF